MTERTPEWHQINAIITKALHNGWGGGEDQNCELSQALAAPLEAANKEIARLRRNEDDILTRAHEAGYSTPHGESDSITEAAAWMSAELARRPRVDDWFIDAANACHGMAEPDKEIQELREAVRVLASECRTWRRRHDTEDVNRMGYSDIDAVNANPTAKAAIEAAKENK